MLVKMECPQCGAPLEMDETATHMFCMYCGTRIENLAQKVEISHTGTVVHKIDRTGEPNLYIKYTSVNPVIPMVLRIESTNQKSTIMSGQDLSFRLAPGHQRLIIKIGPKNYARDIYIPESNEPVNVYASWNRVSQITIDQPQPSTPVTGYTRQTPQAVQPAVQQIVQPVVQQPVVQQQVIQQTIVQQKPEKAHSTVLGIMGFILSLTMYLSPVGVILCILDLVQNKKGCKHGLARAGLVIGIIFSIALVYSVFKR